MELLGEVNNTRFQECSRDELISNILNLQETLADLTKQVDKIKQENSNTREQNLMLKEYVDKLMDPNNSKEKKNERTKNEEEVKKFMEGLLQSNK